MLEPVLIAFLDEGCNRRVNVFTIETGFNLSLFNCLFNIILRVNCIAISFRPRNVKLYMKYSYIFNDKTKKIVLVWQYKKTCVEFINFLQKQLLP